MNLQNHYKILDPEKFGFRVDYIFDFIPDAGIEKLPALFIEKRGANIFYFESEIVGVIPKDKMVFMDDYYVAHKDKGYSIRLDVKSYNTILNSKRIRLSPEATYEHYEQLKYLSHLDEKFRVTKRFKLATSPQITLAPVFGFDGEKITAKISSIILWGDKHRRGEVINININKKESGNGRAAFVKGYEIYELFRPRYFLNKISKKLQEIGFKKKSTRVFYLKNFDSSPKLLWKLKRQTTIKGMYFAVEDSLKQLSPSVDEIEPLVSVKLDKEKSLIYLDVNYYHNRLKVDRRKVQVAVDKHQQIIKVGRHLLKINYKNLKAIDDTIKNKNKLPLEKFYLVFELTRLSKKVEFSKSYKSFFRDLLKLGSLPQQKLPRQLKRSVFVKGYQIIGFNWLSFLAVKNLNGILADEMGLGKTLQALLTVFASRNFKSEANIVVCPKSMLENWRSEIEKFFSFNGVRVHYGYNRLKKLNSSTWEGKIVITTYDVLRRDFKKFLRLRINYFVLDEAQKIKNQGTQVARALKIVNARHKIALTGTPIENRLSELWSIFDFLMPGFWGTPAEFRRHYEIPIVKHGDGQALKELRQISQPLILRRKLKDVIKLPRLVTGIKSCDLYEEQVRLYEDLINDSKTQMIISNIKKGKIRPNSISVIILLQKLRMICSHPDLITKIGKDGSRSGKMELLFQVLQDLIGSKKNGILIFLEFRRNFAFLDEWLKEHGIPFVYMHGESSPSERMKSIDTFNRGEVPVFLVGLKVGGLGLNLTRANYVLIFDRWWNPAVEQQAVARAHRIGQKRIVTAFRFVTKGTIEERLEDLHKRKKALFDNVLETKNVYQRLSKEDVLRLLDRPGLHARIDK